MYLIENISTAASSLHNWLIFAMKIRFKLYWLRAGKRA